MNDCPEPLEELPQRPREWWPVVRPGVRPQRWWFPIGRGLPYWTIWDGERTWIASPQDQKIKDQNIGALRLASFWLALRPTMLRRPLLLVLSESATYQAFDQIKQFEEEAGAFLETQRRPAHSQGEIQVRAKGWRKPRNPELREEREQLLLETIKYYFCPCPSNETDDLPSDPRGQEV